MLKLCQQEDKVAENWEKEFNKLLDITVTSSMELFYMTEVRYEFFRFICFHLSFMNFELIYQARKTVFDHNCHLQTSRRSAVEPFGELLGVWKCMW